MDTHSFEKPKKCERKRVFDISLKISSSLTNSDMRLRRTLQGNSASQPTDLPLSTPTIEALDRKDHPTPKFASLFRGIFRMRKELRWRHRQPANARIRQLIWLALILYFVKRMDTSFPYIRLMLLAASHPRPPPLPRLAYSELLQMVSLLNSKTYDPITANLNYDVLNCPPTPPPGYPQAFPVMDVLGNWSILDTDPTIQKRQIHQGLCIFDFAKASDFDALRHQIKQYRSAERPFLIRNDPSVLPSVHLWNQEGYMEFMLQGKRFPTTFSKNKTMLYFNDSPKARKPPKFVKPMRHSFLTYDQWKYNSQLADKDNIGPNFRFKEYAYITVDSCLEDNPKCDSALHSLPGFLGSHAGDFLYDDLPFFNPNYPEESDLYLVDHRGIKSIQCRFGERGLIAVDHFDSERNYIGVLSGERRYILGHPKNCKDMLHPFERHTRVNWAKPELSVFPDFVNVRVSEVVLQAGDLLYVPTYWFHHIVSLSENIQCNTRSGHSLEFEETIDDCGFMYVMN